VLIPVGEIGEKGRPQVPGLQERRNCTTIVLAVGI